MATAACNEKGSDGLGLGLGLGLLSEYGRGGRG